MRKWAGVLKSVVKNGAAANIGTAEFDHGERYTVSQRPASQRSVVIRDGPVPPFGRGKSRIFAVFLAGGSWILLRLSLCRCLFLLSLSEEEEYVVSLAPPLPTLAKIVK